MRKTQHTGRAILVLDVGRLGLQDEPATVCIHHDLPVARLTFLARRWGYKVVGATVLPLMLARVDKVIE